MCQDVPSTQGTQALLSPSSCSAELLEGAAGADKTPVKEVVWSQAGSRAVLGAEVKTNSLNSKLAFFEFWLNPKRIFFPSLALSYCLNEILVRALPRFPLCWLFPGCRMWDWVGLEMRELLCPCPSGFGWIRGGFGLQHWGRRAAAPITPSSPNWASSPAQTASWGPSH